MDVCSAQTGPIFLAYRSREEINAQVERAKEEAALYDFISPDDIRHRVWRILDRESIRMIGEAFGRVREIYIADGHHRCASAVKVAQKRREKYPEYTGREEFNYFLSVLFPDDQLMIMAYNRLVRDLNGYSEAGFLEKVSERFRVENLGAQATAPCKKGEITMYLGHTWYKLTTLVDAGGNDPVGQLDVSILQKELLTPILGIGDPRTDERIDFAGGIRGLTELERRVGTDCRVAFAMYPTSISELFAVSDAGLLMPPKSTWFEPKLRSGLLIHRIEE